MSLRNKLRAWLGVEQLATDIKTVSSYTALVERACIESRNAQSTTSGGKITEDLVRAEYSPDQTGNVITAEPKILQVYRDQ